MLALICSSCLVHKVPTTDMEALKSPLMGLFEKRLARKFILYVQDYSETDPKTHEGMDLTRVTSRDFILCLSSMHMIVRKVGKVARVIAIMSHPIPNTNESHSVKVILPQKQSDEICIFYVAPTLTMLPLKGKFIAFVSTDAETDHLETELKPGIDLLGPVDEIFFKNYDIYEPVNEPTLDNCFISTSYDATTHFESTVLDVLNMYTLITGKVLDLSVDLSEAKE
ncbi:hypothetical protein TB2_032931 [Malus domestica]